MNAVAVVSAIIPCLDEETAIGRVVTDVLAQHVSEVIVVDGGSRDRTVERAGAAGARVIVEPRRGYGRAIQAGIAAVREDADIIVFLDGDGSDPAENISALLAPILAGEAVFVLGSRIRGVREPGSLGPLGRAVPRAAVDHDDFAHMLRQYRGRDLPDRGFLIEARNDRRDDGHLVHRLQRRPQLAQLFGG